jgi:TIR domain
MYDVFLSHGHEDAAAVEAVAGKLEDEHGLSVWLDRWRLIPGQPWVQELEKGLSETTTCAVFLGPQTPDGWFRNEIDLALDKQAKHSDFRVIPVLLPGTERDSVNGFLRLRDWVELEDEQWGIHLLVCGVRGLAPGRRPTATTGHLARARRLLIDLNSLGELLHPDVKIEAQRKIVFGLIENGPTQ